MVKTESHRTSQRYGTEEFEEGPQTGPYYTQKNKPFEIIFPSLDKYPKLWEN